MKKARSILILCFVFAIMFLYDGSANQVYAAETGNDILDDFTVSVIKDAVKESEILYDQICYTYKSKKIYNSYDEAVNDLGVLLRDVCSIRTENDRYYAVEIPIQFKSEQSDNITADSMGADIYEVLIEITENPDQESMLKNELAAKPVSSFPSLKYKNGYYSGTYVLCAKHKHTKEEYENFKEKANQIIEELKLNENKSDIQKLYTLFHWIASDQGNITYASTGKVVNGNVISDDQSAYSALVEGGAVCAGFSYLYHYLALSIGIENYCGEGRNENYVGHQWIITKQEGKYYYIDPSNMFTDDSFLIGTQIGVGYPLNVIIDVNNEKENEIRSLLAEERYPLDDSILNCTHENTIIKDKKDATITSTGYTGDTYCTDCERIINKGEELPKKNFDITLSQTSFSYNHAECKPSVTVKDLDGTLLREGTDYTVTYANNCNVSTASVTVTGIGSYERGETKTTFTISPTAIEESDISYTKEQTYTGSEIQPEVSITKEMDTIYQLEEGTDYTITYENNINKGTGIIKIQGKGNFTGNHECDFTILPASIENKTITLEASSFTYTGEEIRPTVTVAGLMEEDYTVSYEDNIAIGTATVKISGQGNYTGTATDHFQINKIDITGKVITLEKDSFVYTGEEIKPSVVWDDIPSDTYTLEYSNNTNAGTASIKVTGTGNYTGETSRTFAILPKNINDAGVSAALQDNVTVYEWESGEICPAVVVSGLSESDYTVTYQNNDKIGDAKAVISGKNNYTGQIEISFSIVAKKTDINALSENISMDAGPHTYIGKEIRPEVSISGLTKNADYEVTYTNNINVTTNTSKAKILINGIGLYKGSIEKDFEIQPAEIKEDQVVLSSPSFTYTGKEIHPEVSIEGLVLDKDYTVQYKNCKNVTSDTSKAEVVVTGTGNYKGEVKKEFDISPKPLTDDDISLQYSTYEYIGTAIEPRVIATGFSEDDYEVTYSNNVNTGTGTVTITGKGNYIGEVKKEFTITKADITDAVKGCLLGTNGFENQGSSFYYTGTPICPSMTIRGNIIENVDYVIEYENNIAVGTASVMAKGIGNYTGEYRFDFQIIPAQEQGSSSSDTGTSGNTTTNRTQTGSNSTVPIKVTGISNFIAAGKKIKLTAESLSGTPGTITWSSSNTKVATVSQSGIVTLNKKSAGKSVIITAKSSNGSTSTFKIKSMKSVVKKVTVSGAKTVKAGKSLKLKAKVSASAGANKKIKWLSSNEALAKVSSSGKVVTTKSAKGKFVKITAMATDGSGKKKTVTIKIK